MSDKIQKEKEFHNSAFSDGRRAKLDGIYATTQSSVQKYVDLITQDSQGKSILEYGCGPGSQAYTLAQNGAIVTGIDISEIAIEQASNRARELSLDIEFFVANAEDFDLGEHRFDRIVGSAIIHHLDINKAFTSISRALKPDGECIFYEPLGHNVLINIFRKLTPRLRTEDEHPLTSKDLLKITSYFEHSLVTYYHLTSLCVIPFTRFKIFPTLLQFTEKLDRYFFKLFPFLKNQAWIAVICLREPKI